VIPERIIFVCGGITVVCVETDIARVQNSCSTRDINFTKLIDFK